MPSLDWLMGKKEVQYTGYSGKDSTKGWYSGKSDEQTGSHGNRRRSGVAVQVKVIKGLFENDNQTGFNRMDCHISANHGDNYHPGVWIQLFFGEFLAVCNSSDWKLNRRIESNWSSTWRSHHGYESARHIAEDKTGWKSKVKPHPGGEVHLSSDLGKLARLHIKGQES